MISDPLEPAHPKWFSEIRAQGEDTLHLGDLQNAHTIEGRLPPRAEDFDTAIDAERRSRAAQAESAQNFASRRNREGRAFVGSGGRKQS